MISLFSVLLHLTADKALTPRDDHLQTHNPAGMGDVVCIRQIKFTEGADDTHVCDSFFVFAVE